MFKIIEERYAKSINSLDNIIIIDGKIPIACFIRGTEMNDCSIILDINCSYEDTDYAYIFAGLLIYCASFIKVNITYE